MVANRPHSSPLEQAEIAKNNRAARYSVLKSALIECRNPDLGIECVVTDISKSGMRALLDNAQDLPDTLFLTIKNNNRTYECEVAWKSDVEAGLQIIRNL